MSPPKVHSVCKQIKDLRMAAHLSLTQAGEMLGISPIVLGSYERGDRMPSIARVDAILNGYGYRIVAVPVEFDAVRLPSDMAAELRAIADQIEKDKRPDDVLQLSSIAAL